MSSVITLSRFAAIGVGLLPALSFAALPPEISDVHARHVSRTAAGLFAVISSALPLRAWFEWGTTPSLGSATSPESSAVAVPPLFLRAELPPLPPLSRIYYRCVARSEAGLSVDSLRFFITDPPSVTTLLPDSVTADGATLRLLCASAGDSVAPAFFLGPDSTWVASVVGIPPRLPVAGDTVRVRVGGLAPGSLFFVRAHAALAAAPDVDADGSALAFTTLPDSAPAGAVFPLIFSGDGADARRTLLCIGFHSSATRCIDPLLGERELPPDPPGAAAPALILPCGGMRSAVDLRPFPPEEGCDTFVVRSDGGTISWGAPDSLFQGAVTLLSDGGRVDMRSACSAGTNGVARVIACAPARRPHLPVAVTLPSDDSARGVVWPDGMETAAHLEWGAGFEGRSGGFSAGNGTAPVTIAAPIPLSAGTGYRIVARNPAGRAAGLCETLGTGSVTLVPQARDTHVAFTVEFLPGGIAGVRFALSRPAAVALRVYDLLGREVARRDLGTAEAGEHFVALGMQGAASGIYFCRLRAGNDAAVRKVVVVR